MSKSKIQNRRFEGRRVGLVAPSGPPLDPQALARGLVELEFRGIELIRPRDEYPAHGFLAGTDEERAAELSALFARTDLDVVFAVRGGYGALRLLDRIDFDAAAEHPKVLVGYSDLTALQLALFALSGWRGLSGPMVAVEWPAPHPDWEDPFWDLLDGPAGQRLVAADGSSPGVLVPGTAQGIMLGGNLAMVTKLVGTPYLPDLEGCILFLEDVGEEPYRIDGLFAQLRLAGILEGVAGVVLGAFTDSDPRPNRPSFTVDEVIRRYFADAPYPVVTGWNYGHFPLKVPMPIGVRAALSAQLDGRVSLTTLEALQP